MKLVATGVIATGDGGKRARPARPRLDAGPDVKPVAITGLPTIGPVPPDATISFRGGPRPVLKT